MNRRQFLRLAGIGFAAPFVQPTGIKFPPGVVTQIPAGGVVTLTIDDGWNPLVIKVMLENLRHSWVRATWFLIGQAMLTSFGDNERLLGPERWVREQNRELMWLGNHSIAYHSMRHEPMTILGRWNRTRWQADYDEWFETYYEIFTQWEPDHRHSPWTPQLDPYARAPWGMFTDAFMEFCEDNELKPIGWSNDLSEWRWGLPIQAGQIVLAHSRLVDHEFVNHILYLRRAEEFTVTDVWMAFHIRKRMIQERIEELANNHR